MIIKRFISTHKIEKFQVIIENEMQKKTIFIFVNKLIAQNNYNIRVKIYCKLL